MVGNGPFEYIYSNEIGDAAHVASGRIVEWLKLKYGLTDEEVVIIDGLEYVPKVYYKHAIGVEFDDHDPPIERRVGTRNKVTTAVWSKPTDENSDEELLSGHDATQDSWDVIGTLCDKIAEQKATTFARFLEASEEALAQVDGGDIATQGIDVFVQGVEVHTRRVLNPNGKFRELVEMKPGLIPMAIYMGVMGTIDYMLENSDVLQLPLLVRGFAVCFSMVAWNDLVESGANFDPGSGKMPSDFMEVLGFTSDAVEQARFR